MSMPDRPIPATVPPSSPAIKPQRVLACVLCQQRKVKCDRSFPCSNCTRSNVQCVPAGALPSRQRRRRFPERELLDRLRRYEKLLRQNNIDFTPLHKDSPIDKDESLAHGSTGNVQTEPPVRGSRSESPSSTISSKRLYKPKNIWSAMNQKSQDTDDDDDDGDATSPENMQQTVRAIWSTTGMQNSELLSFGFRSTGLELWSLHPDQVQIFKLWQIYLDNVDPLLKATHSPTLQGRIIDAAGHVASIKPPLAALMFGVYCVSITCLEEDQCRDMFGASKEALLARYQSGCQQALMISGFLRSNEYDCLTAFLFYLISVRPNIDLVTLSSMLGTAMRAAHRMGLHDESTHAKRPALEAEVRRRLWWALLLFDTRMCEMVDHTSVTMIPTWSCNPPLNINDIDLRPEMKGAPVAQRYPTETIFAVVRSEMGDFIRNSSSYLDFINPALKLMAKDAYRGSIPESGEISALERLIEDKYLRVCNPENPLHYMTIWFARCQLAKSRLVEHYAQNARSSVPQTDEQRDTAASYALDNLECDTKLMSTPSIEQYRWFTQMYFPFPAYVHVLADLRRRPLCRHAERAWEAMSANYEARWKYLPQDISPIFSLFAQIVLHSWQARERACNPSGEVLEPPRIAKDVKQRLNTLVPPDIANAHPKPAGNDTSKTSFDELPAAMPLGFGVQDFPDMQLNGGAETAGYPDLSGQPGMDFGMRQLQLLWDTMDWNPMQGLDGEGASFHGVG